MSGLRLSATAALGALAMLLTISGPAAAASTTTSNITITSVGADASGDPYDLTVIADDGNNQPIQSMTAHVFSASGQDVADVPMTVQDDSDLTSQVFAATTPISETALPAGTYTVTVDASDVDESDQGLTGGSFSFTYASSSLDVVATPATVTQGSESVTFSGTLTGTATSASPVGIANATVSLSVAGAAATVVGQTSATGQFTDTITGIGATADYDFSVPDANSYPAASDDVTVTAVQAASAMTVSADPATVTEGIQTVTFSGSVSATVTPPPPASPTTVNIGGGVPVDLSIDGGAASQVTTTTDAAGDFTYTTTDTAPGNYTFSIDQSNLYTGASYKVAVGSQMAPTAMTVQPSQPSVTFGSTSVTFTGSVKASPQGGSTQGIGSGVPVYLSIGGGAASQVTTTTDTAGDFSYTASNITSGTDYDFAVNSTALYAGASEDVAIPAVQGAANLSVAASPPDTDLSASSVTYTGTATVTPAGSTTPTGIGAGVPVYLSISGGTPQEVTTTTDAAGDFTYTAPGPAEPADYDFEIRAGTFYTQASDDVPLGPAQQASLTVTPNASNVTEGAQRVTFSGTLTGVKPGSTTANDIQNAPVWLSVNGGPASQVATTDANGDFTYTGGDISATTTYAFSVTQKLPSYTAATAALAIGVTQSRTRIAGLIVSPAHLKYGQRARLTGTVQYLDGTSWVALPGSVVHLRESNTVLTPATAGSDGRFTASLPTTHGPGWTATVNAGALTQETTSTGNLTIALPMKVRSFAARLNVDDKAVISGCLQMTAPVGYGPSTSVLIQYAASQHGRWRSLGRLPLHNRAGAYRTCRSNDESYFTGSIAAKLANAYYRADFPATVSFQGIDSRAVHAWKYQTRIVSFSAAPRAVKTGQVVTVRARLELRGRTWRPWAGRYVNVLVNDLGTSTWYSVGRAKTGQNGFVTVRVRASAGSYVAATYAVYGGDATHLASRGPGIDVSINDGSPAPDRVPETPDLASLPPVSSPPVPLLPAFSDPAGLPLALLLPTTRPAGESR